jgi:hypothetical protein
VEARGVDVFLIAAVTFSAITQTSRQFARKLAHRFDRCAREDDDFASGAANADGQPIDDGAAK